MNPSVASSEDTRSAIRPTITSSGTRSPRSMYSLASLPRSLPSRTAARRMSPVGEYGKAEVLLQPLAPRPLSGTGRAQEHEIELGHRPESLESRGRNGTSGAAQQGPERGHHPRPLAGDLLMGERKHVVPGDGEPAELGVAPGRTPGGDAGAGSSGARRRGAPPASRHHEVALHEDVHAAASGQSGLANEIEEGCLQTLGLRIRRRCRVVVE